ncbi:type III-B CRISPR module RAMP protein Cmr1 [Salinivibrio sp. SS2]|uniref:type III-B CRISPR module RAMP protein Cmr1 n=1 Tax=Salinivibrio sp. SS2 TaxID=1892894 RepID=UPI00084C10B6|nr:type III-B CRISPR module RAMP protein Cmr1 [Salinivibrio sp. DV]ODQ01750.1 type III-B CRISPR module RAMP protein Cmr1 [Salinivibrio sp. DV]
MRRKTKRKDFAALNEELKQIAHKSDENRWESYECQLVTPMYGGGVLAGEIDQAMPIRASAIRGHLRFWWRIACGPDNPKGLRSAEEAIWGGIGDHGAKASKVRIKVDNVRYNGDVPSFTYERRGGTRSKYKTVPKPNAELGHAYALFSAQGKLTKDKTHIEEKPKKIAKPGLVFSLKVCFNSYGDMRLSQQQMLEVQEAIRWWISFGGIGSRTRRGLGAIKLTKDNLRVVTRQEVAERGGRLVTLSDSSARGPIDCWRLAVDKLRSFRQGKGIGRNYPNESSNSPAGQSRWPEADSVRNISGSWSEKHRPKNSNINLFPRAAFGLPIVFHFQKNKGEDKSDPDDHTLGLAGQERKRMASPLILKPYLSESGKWLPAVLLLPDWQRALSADLDLSLTSQQDEKDHPKNSSPASAKEPPKRWPSSEHERDELAKRIPPMNDNGRLRANDPLHAFLDFFEKG